MSRSLLPLLPLLLALWLAPGSPAGPREASAQWVLEPGEGWAQLTAFRHDTDEEFKRDGSVGEFDNQGRALTHSFFFTAAVGVAEGLDAWAQVPIQRLEFTDVASDLEKTAVGDTRVWLRVGPELVAKGAAEALPVRVAVRGGVKFPVSEFPVDSEIIPVTDGQRDWEAVLEVGRSFWPMPLYAKAWIGHRWREENEKIIRDFGNEIIGLVEVGGDPGRVSWRLTANGLWGDPPVIEGIRVESATRKIVELLPVVGVDVGRVTLELGGRFPVDGRNLPTGPALRAGFFVPWSL